MISLLLSAFLLIVGWVSLFILFRRNENKVAQDWNDLLSNNKSVWYKHVKEDVENTNELVNTVIEEAIDVKELGNEEEAIKLLKIGSDIIQEFAPNLLFLLKNMIKFSRMVSAMVPITPLRQRNFKLAELYNFVGLYQMLNAVIISSKQKFKLKLRIIGVGIKIISSFLLQKIKRVSLKKSITRSEFENITDAVQDFQVLSKESVESFKNLLNALPPSTAKQLMENLKIKTANKG